MDPFTMIGTAADPRNILACNLASYGRYRDGALPHLREIGVRYVEIPVPPPDQVEAVRARLDRYGLGCLSMQLPCDVSSDEALARTCERLPIFREFGARIAFVSVKHGQASLAESYERLRRLGDAAARHGVIIAIETHPPFAHNADAALTTLRAVDHPHLRLNYDTANVYYYNENFDGLADLERILQDIVSVHLKDTNGGYRTWYFPALGEGVVDFPAIFRLLNARGFFGPFTLEIEGIEGENLSEAETWQRVAHSVNYLRTRGLIL